VYAPSKGCYMSLVQHPSGVLHALGTDLQTHRGRDGVKGERRKHAYVISAGPSGF
jgi:hypothetical protein